MRQASQLLKLQDVLQFVLSAHKASVSSASEFCAPDPAIVPTNRCYANCTHPFSVFSAAKRSLFFPIQPRFYIRRHPVPLQFFRADWTTRTHLRLLELAPPNFFPSDMWNECAPAMNKLCTFGSADRILDREDLLMPEINIPQVRDVGHRGWLSQKIVIFPFRNWGNSGLNMHCVKNEWVPFAVKGVTIAFAVD